jgi:hypothetical protein
VTVTLTTTTPSNEFFVVVELSDAAVDVAGQAYAAGSPSVGPSFTPAGARELFVAFCNSPVDAQSASPAGWTHLVDDGGVYFSAYSLAGTSGVAAAPSWTTTAEMIVAAVFSPVTPAAPASGVFQFLRGG